MKPVTRLDVSTMSADFCRNFDVHLNGVRQRLCTVADVKEGYVVRYRTGVFGRPVKGASGVLKTQKMYGVVTITEKVKK